MLPPQAAVGSSVSLDSDPFQWTVDEVVFALCSPESKVLTQDDALHLPDPAKFAEILREQEINGRALLSVPDQQTLRDDLGVKAYGHRMNIMHLIEKLQSLSSIYQTRSERQSFSRAGTCGLDASSRVVTPLWASPCLVHAGVQSGVEVRSPSLNPLRSIALNSRQQADNLSLQSNGGSGTKGLDKIQESSSPRASNETFIMDGNGRKRRRLVLGPENTVQAPLNHAETHDIRPSGMSSTEGVLVSTGNTENLAEQVEMTAPSNMGEHTRDQLRPCKSVPDKLQVALQSTKKRIQPTLVSDENGVGFTDTNNLESWTITDPGVGPLQSSSTLGLLQPSPNIATATLGRQAVRNSKDQYLGLRAMPVDSLFYGDVEFGHEPFSLDSDEEDSLSFHSVKTFPAGQKQYVHSRMKHFYQQSLLSVSSNGKSSFGILPYPDGIGRKGYPLSATVFTEYNDKISVARVNRHKWVPQRRAPDEERMGESSQNFHVADPALAVNETDDVDWQTLKKWNYIETDTVLPGYGDSASEGEYDLETWREMELESGSITRPEGRSRRAPLALDAVYSAIDEAVASMRDVWRSKKHPKLHHIAWREWIRSRKHKTLQQQLQSLDEDLNKLQARAAKYRKEIASEQWSNVKKVKLQSKIMEPTIVDEETCSWRIESLQAHKPPDKPATKQTVQSRGRQPEPTQPLEEGEEDIASTVDSEEEQDTDDSLGDFVVEDEVDHSIPSPILDDDELVLADIEESAGSDEKVPPLKDEPLRTPKKKIETTKVNSRSNQSPIRSTVIDLTQKSDLHSPASSSSQFAGDRSVVAKVVIPKVEPFDARTTPKATSDEDSEVKLRASRRRTRQGTPKFRMPSRPSIVVAPEVIVLDTDSDGPVVGPSHRKSLPPLHDIEAIFSLQYVELREQQDRPRFLVWLVARCPENLRHRTLEYFRRRPQERCHADVVEGLQSLLDQKMPIPGMNKVKSELVLQVTAWFIGWTVLERPLKIGFRIAQIKTTSENIDGFGAFHELLTKCLAYFQPQEASSSKVLKKRPLESESSETCDTEAEREALFATESQETLDKRDVAMRRLRDVQQRREQLKGRLAKIPLKGSDRSNVTVNPGKLEEQDFIKLHPDFGNGAHLKPHQEEGLQFMWREITGDHADLQGCLLAQTMGLGKSVQIIALLVALSDAANSDNPNIQEQVPASLHRSKTLILCPPSLIENWFDEFVMWPPSENHLGTLRKVSSAQPMRDRLAEIRAWNEEGGILILGFSTFRDLLETKNSKGPPSNKLARLNESQNEAIEAALLEGPNLVIADEAHEIKNQSAKIHIAVNRIQCKSRIALTGSPLANNLGEYFSLIDWIAPGYLGTFAEFTTTYEEPITRGLYKDSTNAQYRESRKRLKALELELEPKVHRADVSALHNNLYGKREFVIKLPLTEAQDALYRNFVGCMVNLAKNEDGARKHIWSWMGALQLICNHPQSYLDELANKRQKEDALLPRLTTAAHKGLGMEETTNHSASSEEDLDVPEIHLSAAVINATFPGAQEICSGLAEPSDAIAHSKKMAILFRILELSLHVNDKVLIFSHRLATLDYVKKQLENLNWKFVRIAGEIPPSQRQRITKEFNEGSIGIALISTRAGGQGLNLFSANRVVILDEQFNPMWEQQAVGRAYRIGQTKEVFVYRLTTAGTFEQEIENQSRFKEQLATRVVDKKSLVRNAGRKTKDYLHEPRPTLKEDLSGFVGKDHHVLDYLLENPVETPILSITPTETFYVEDDQELTQEERLEAEQMQRDEQLRRRDPVRYNALMEKRRSDLHHTMAASRPDIPPIATPYASQLTGNLGIPPPTANLPFSLPPPTENTHSTNRSSQKLQSQVSVAPDLRPVPATNTKSRPMSRKADHEAPASSNFKSAIGYKLPSFTQAGNLRRAASEYSVSSRDNLQFEVSDLINSVVKSQNVTMPRKQIILEIRESAEAGFYKTLAKKSNASTALSMGDPRSIAESINAIIILIARNSDEYGRLFQGVDKLLAKDDVDPNFLIGCLHEQQSATGVDSLNSTVSSKRQLDAATDRESLPRKRHKPSSLPSLEFKSSGDVETGFQDLLRREELIRPRV